MRGILALLILTATAAAAIVPTAEAHSCSGTYCGPCEPGEEHAHSDSTGSCVSYAERDEREWSGGVSAGAGGSGARANANFSPGGGAMGALAALGVAALALTRRA